MYMAFFDPFQNVIMIWRLLYNKYYYFEHNPNHVK